MSKCPRVDIKNVEKKDSPEDFMTSELYKSGIRVVDSSSLSILFSKARKFYMRLRRPNNGTGMEKPYEDYCDELGITREEADRLYFNYLRRKYPELVRLILKYDRISN